ncbi:hypothetical protein [Streptomyces sp. NPDC091294]|uniref:hypothetical protein n=1 Tax=Streptomyces sp. NPDC091294 TaxID=3365992 RepID=UPI0037F84D60
MPPPSTHDGLPERVLAQPPFSNRPATRVHNGGQPVVVRGEVYLPGFDQSPAQLRDLGRAVGRGQGLGGLQQGAGVAADIAVAHALRYGVGEQIHG